MKKHDFWIIGGIVVLAAVCAIAAWLLRSDAGYARIYLDGELYQTVSLDQTTDVEIAQPDGSVNIVHISTDGVSMAYATCPNQNCVEQGVLTPKNSGTVLSNNWIVCLPNRVSVEVVWENAS